MARATQSAVLSLRIFAARAETGNWKLETENSQWVAGGTRTRSFRFNGLLQVNNRPGRMRSKSVSGSAGDGKQRGAGAK